MQLQEKISLGNSQQEKISLGNSQKFSVVTVALFWFSNLKCYDSKRVVNPSQRKEYFESLRVMLNYTTELGLLDQQHDGLVAVIMLTVQQLKSLERLEEVHNKQRKVEHSLLSAKDRELRGREAYHIIYVVTSFASFEGELDVLRP